MVRQQVHQSTNKVLEQPGGFLDSISNFGLLGKVVDGLAPSVVSDLPGNMKDLTPAEEAEIAIAQKKYLADNVDNGGYTQADKDAIKNIESNVKTVETKVKTKVANGDATETAEQSLIDPALGLGALTVPGATQAPNHIQAGLDAEPAPYVSPGAGNVKGNSLVETGTGNHIQDGLTC